MKRRKQNHNGTDLRLEHYKRIQTKLTGLVERHRQEGQNNAEEFVRTLIDYERVHIVTVKENYDEMRAQGDYEKAGISLVSWNEIKADRRAELWRKMLHGKVANADAYAPQPAAGGLARRSSRTSQNGGAP